MENVDSIINARWIVPVSEHQPQCLENHAVVIRDDVIIAILPQEKVGKRYQASVEHHLTDHCLIPGLINAHAHSAMSLFRGMADDLPLMTWLNEHIWPAEQRFLGDEFVRAGSDLAIAEMLRGGTTCFNDMYFFPESTARAADEAGIRATLGMVVIDFPTSYSKGVEEYLLKGQLLHDRYRNHPLINTAYAPHAPYTVSDPALQTIITNAEEMDVPIHMHIHETATEVEQSIKQYGIRPLERLRNIGLLSPRLVAVHMTQLTEQEMDWCAEAGVTVAHCPESNLKLASGFCPVAALQQRDITVAIGTDGAASNNDLDMFAELRQAALLAKAVAGDPSQVPALEALKMATINGAKALGIDAVTGSIDKQKAADLVAVKLSDIETQPMYDVVSQLVYATGRDKVTDVWVAGKQLLKNRHLTTINESQIIETSQHWAQQIRQKQ
jgi:5-methylthioadenosine/S-adenosylhomocysteine deaminase